MISKEFEKVIKIINERFRKNKIQWALIGSTNMAIQGIKVIPRDLDIVVHLSDLKKIKSIFSEYNPSEIMELKPFTKEQVWEVKVIIENIEVQVLGERTTGEYVRRLLPNQLVKIKLDGADIPCFTLEAEAQTYAATKRQHKADLINNFLRK